MKIPVSRAVPNVSCKIWQSNRFTVRSWMGIRLNKANTNFIFHCMDRNVRVML